MREYTVMLLVYAGVCGIVPAIFVRLWRRGKIMMAAVAGLVGALGVWLFAGILLIEYEDKYRGPEALKWTYEGMNTRDFAIMASWNVVVYGLMVATIIMLGLRVARVASRRFGEGSSPVDTTTSSGGP